MTSNIAIVTRHTYPSDQEIRVTKLIDSFAKKDYSTTIFCPQENKESDLKHRNFNVCGKLNNDANFFIKLINAPIPINLIWSYWLYKNFCANAIKLVIIRDLRLFIPAYIAAKIMKINVILDIGEHYPGMVEILGKQKIRHYITRNIFLITILEALSVFLANKVWVVAEENRLRLLKFNKNIDVISNNPMDDSWIKYPIIKTNDYKSHGDPITLVSFGLIDNIRGIEYAIDIIEAIKEKLPNIRLLIFGDGPYKRILEKKVNKIGLQDKIKFKGWIRSDKKYAALQQGDLGIIFHKECRLTNHTIPNKIFDYMSMGLPVVSTNLHPVRRIINKEKCGYIISSSIELAQNQIVNIIINSESRKESSVNARNAMINGYKWNEDEKKLLECVSQLI